MVRYFFKASLSSLLPLLNLQKNITWSSQAAQYISFNHAPVPTVEGPKVPQLLIVQLPALAGAEPLQLVVHGRHLLVLHLVGGHHLCNHSTSSQSSIIKPPLVIYSPVGRGTGPVSCGGQRT